MTDTILLDGGDVRKANPYVIQVLKWPAGWIDEALFGDLQTATDETKELARLRPTESYRLVLRTEDSDDR